MNYVQPLTANKSVTDEGITYTVKYYQAPQTLTGVTDESYGEYVSGTTYNTGDYVKLDDLKGIYRSSDDSNVGNYPPANPTKWTFWSPLNSYCMLAVDEFIGSQTTGTDIVMEFDFNGSNAFGLVDLSFNALTVEVIDDSDGSVVWTETYSGSNYGATSYYEYFYSSYWDTTRIYEGGLPLLVSSTLKFTFTGEASIGTVVIGLEEELGCTIYGTSLRFEDTSTIQKSEITGYRTVTRYGNVRIVNADVLVSVELFNTIAQKIDKIIGRNILFLPNDNEDKFQEMITIGYFENFEIPADGSDEIKTSTSIIGVL